MSMYYNPQSKEIMEADELKCFLNASFPENEEVVLDWNLIHDDFPEISSSQSAIPDKIEEIDGKYFQTYKIVEIGPVHDDSNLQATLEERISAIESGIVEIAQILSNGGRL